MTPLELRTQFENLIGDSHDVTHTYQLLTQAKNEIETKLKLKILEANDASQTANSGDTYLTLKSLPANFKQMNKLFVGTIQYFPIPFNQRITYRQSARRFYIDYKRMVAGSTALGLCGAVASAQTINMFYTAKTDDLTEAVENTAGLILWPDEFQPIIPYKAAKIFEANIDADDIAFRMSAAQEAEYQSLLDAFIAWDQDIKLAEMNNQGGYADDYNDIPFDVGSM